MAAPAVSWVWTWMGTSGKRSLKEPTSKRAAAGVSSSWYNRRFFYNDKDNQPFHGKRR